MKDCIILFLKKKSIDVLLPKELDNYYLGLIPSLYQFVVTWMRYENSGKLLLSIGNPESTDWSKLYENDLLFPLVSLVWNKNEVFNKNGSINLRPYLKPINISLFDTMRQAKPLKGKKLLLTEFDHLPEDRGLLPCFEPYNEFIKSESILFNTLRQSIASILDYSIEIKLNFQGINKDIVGIIFELMKNTFEWAKADENGVALDPNLRGVLMRFYKKRRSSLLEDFKNHEGLQNYFSSTRLKENIQEELYFIEVSVFDSGIGFVKRYNSLYNTEGDTDVEIIKKCLVKHSTTAKGLEKDDKGLGLDRILSILNLKGFLRIKSNGACVYRNLITHPYKAIEGDEFRNMELFDWKLNKDDNYSSLNNAEGAVITIIYPLSITQPNEELFSI